CAFAALSAGGWGLWLLYPAMSLAIMAAGYAWIGPSIFRKRADGTIPFETRIVLGPVLFGTWVWRRLYRSAEPRAAEGNAWVLVGARVRRRQARELIADGVTAV